VPDAKREKDRRDLETPGRPGVCILVLSDYGAAIDLRMAFRQKRSNEIGRIL
jgi:hypothetical protein